MFEEHLRDELRLAVQQFRARERRRVFPPVLHLGRLTGDCVCWQVEPGERLDVGLRTDIASALLTRVLSDHPSDQRAGPPDPPSAWLTRMGSPLPHDEDFAWSGPIHRAFDASMVEPRCVVVVTKTGWYEPQGLQGAHWKRPRTRRRH